MVETVESLLTGIKDMAAQANGVWNFDILSADPWDIIRAAMDDKRAVHGNDLLCLINLTMREVTGRKPPAMCVCCEYLFDGKDIGAFVLWMPAIGTPTKTIVNMLCPDCAMVPDPERGERVLAVYKRYFLTDDARFVYPKD